MAGRRSVIDSEDTTLRRNLAAYLRSRNFERAHTRQRSSGRPPAELVYGSRKLLPPISRRCREIPDAGQSRRWRFSFSGSTSAPWPGAVLSRMRPSRISTGSVSKSSSNFSNTLYSPGYWQVLR